MPDKTNNETVNLWTSIVDNDIDGCRSALSNGGDPMSDFSMALRLAATKGNAYILRIVIPLSDPKALESEALVKAAQNGHFDCVKILMDVSDLDAARRQLEEIGDIDGLYIVQAAIQEKCLRDKEFSLGNLSPKSASKRHV